MTDLTISCRARRIPDIERVIAAITFVLVLMMIAAPLLYLLYGSFRTGAPGDPNAIFTLESWQTVYGTWKYLSAFFNSMVVGATVAGLSVLLGIMLAWIIARTNAPWRRQLAPLLVLPLMISSLVTTLAWIALAAPNAGFINSLVRNVFGIRSLVDIYSFWGIVFVMVMHFSSYAFIPIYAALRSIDGTLEEASYMLGASPLRTAFRMTFPLIWPVLASAFLLIFILAAETFSVPHLLGASKGYHTLASNIFLDMSVEPGQPALAAAAGTMLLWIALVGTLWQRSIIRNAGRYVTIGGKGGRYHVTELGRWRWVATGFILLYLLLSVILPYLALILASLMKFVTSNITMNSFSLANYVKLFSGNFNQPIGNSLLFSLVGGLATTAICALVSYFIQRSRTAAGRFLDYAVIIPTVIPALVLGVGMVWAYVSIPLGIYGTAWILFLGYLTRYLGQGVRQSRAALIQISAELSEAGRMAGATPLRVLKDIVVPLLRPALISLWTVLFILIFMEISVTIILYGPRTQTLPTLLWSRMQGGYQTEAFAIAVVQATCVFAILFIADRLFGTLRNTLEHS